MAQAGICTVNDCGKPVCAAGYCENHYRRNLRYGNPLAVGRQPMRFRSCAVDGCNRNASRRGWCHKHYERWLAHGDPETLLKASNGLLEKWLLSNVRHSGDECLRWPFNKGLSGYSGYAVVAGKTDYAHRHMCALAHGEQPTALHEVAHACGNGHRACINPRHLRWDTHVGNMKDCISHGTLCRGDRSGTAKLTAADVRQIRIRAKSEMFTAVAKSYGVSGSTVGAIIRGKSWAWLP